MPLDRHTCRWLVLGLLLTPAACREPDGTGPATADVEGHWIVVTFGGDPMPVTDRFQDPVFGNCTFTFDSMAISFFSDGRYAGMRSSTSGCDAFAPQTELREFGGTYRLGGNRIFATSNVIGAIESVLSYTLDGNSLTLEENTGGVLATYGLIRRPPATTQSP